jgi:hypothetical protein
MLLQIKISELPIAQPNDSSYVLGYQNGKTVRFAVNDLQPKQVDVLTIFLVIMIVTTSVAVYNIFRKTRRKTGVFY